MAAYCFAVNTYNSLQPSLSTHQADVYHQLPSDLIDHVMSHVTAGVYNNWPEESQNFANFLVRYHNHMADFAQGQLLQSLGKGMWLKWNMIHLLSWLLSRMMGMRKVEKLRRLSLLCLFPIIPSVFIIFSRDNRLGMSQPFIFQVRAIRALDVHGCKRLKSLLYMCSVATWENHDIGEQWQNASLTIEIWISLNV